LISGSLNTEILMFSDIALSIKDFNSSSSLTDKKIR
jgi:hypothetical protein